MSLRRLAPVLAGLIGLSTITASPALALNIPAGELIGQLPGWPTIKLQATDVEALRPGVTLSSVELITSAGPLHIHQLDADLSAGLSLGTVVADNSVVSVGETVSSMATRTGAIGGINGDYFAIHDS